MKIPGADFSSSGMLLEGRDRIADIRIATWTILSIVIAVVIIRQIMKAFVFRRATIDDIYFIFSAIFAVGLSITTYLLSLHALGVSRPLTSDESDILMRGYYASEFLYISAVCAAKLSLLVLFYNLAPVQRLTRRFMLGFGMFIFAWSIASLVAVAFTCGMPRPWDISTLQCFNTQIFWVTYCVIDTFSEFAIILLSVILVAFLKLPLRRKFAIFACFALRVLVVAAALSRLVFLYPRTPHPQYRLWVPSILAQVQVCLSICTASIPYAIPLFKTLNNDVRSFQSGKNRDRLPDEETGHSKSSLWFRRQNKVEIRSSRDSASVASIRYERISQTSPYILNPRPMTPLSPLQSEIPLSRSASVLGLNIYIPCRDPRRQREVDLASPRTESSGALSPTCASPQALLSQSFVPARKAPIPPPRIYSPKPPTFKSCISSRVPTPSGTPGTQRFSLFPSQRSPSRSPQPHQHPMATPSVPPIRSMQAQSVSNNMRNLDIVSPYSFPSYQAHPTRSSSRAQVPKFSTTTHLQTPPPITAKVLVNARPGSIQDLTSPMGAAINNYFSSAGPTASPTSPLRSTALTSRYGQGALLPTERLTTSPPTSHNRSPGPGDVLDEQLGLSRDSIFTM